MSYVCDIMVAQQKRRAGERFWEWLGPTMPRSAFKHLTYRVPYEQLFDLSEFIKPKVRACDKTAALHGWCCGANVHECDVRR